MRTMVLATLLSSIFAFAIMGASGREDAFEEGAVSAQVSKASAPITEELEEEESNVEAGEQSFEDAFHSLDSMVDKMDIAAKEAKEDFPDARFKQPKSNTKAETSPAAKSPAMTEVDDILVKTKKDLADDSTSASITKAKSVVEAAPKKVAKKVAKKVVETTKSADAKKAKMLETSTKGQAPAPAPAPAAKKPKHSAAPAATVLSPLVSAAVILGVV